MRRHVPRIAVALLAAVAPSFVVSSAEARATPAPKLTKIRCIPKTSVACSTSVHVAVGGKLQLSGQGFKRGQRVSFRWSRGALATKLVKDRTGWTVRVPAGTAIGTISVTVAKGAGRRSNVVRIRVVAKAVEKVSTIAPAGPSGLPNAFEGDGMWIWYVDKSDGGDLDAIAARAKAAGMSTVFVKSADGTSSTITVNILGSNGNAVISTATA
ncbi:MAG: VCBS domain-containing protein, partial [Solirubrobacteraceae bacterium]|nr:VCBS domain-containing protein [Solirubrobacteraceae bacterium]